MSFWKISPLIVLFTSSLAFGDREVSCTGGHNIGPTLYKTRVLGVLSSSKTLPEVAVKLSADVSEAEEEETYKPVLETGAKMLAADADYKPKNKKYSNSNRFLISANQTITYLLLPRSIGSEDAFTAYVQFTGEKKYGTVEVQCRFVDVQARDNNRLSPACRKAVYDAAVEYGLNPQTDRIFLTGDDENSEAVIYNHESGSEYTLWLSTEKKGKTCKVTFVDDCGP